jgi:hypothetical protein
MSKGLLLSKAIAALTLVSIFSYAFWYSVTRPNSFHSTVFFFFLVAFVIAFAFGVLTYEEK